MHAISKVLNIEIQTICLHENVCRKTALRVRFVRRQMKTIRRDQVYGKKQTFYQIKSRLQNGNGNGKLLQGSTYT